MDIETIRKALHAPFPPEDIEWRIASSGKNKNDKVWATAFAYITARAIFERLDSVVGMNNWQCAYTVVANGVICKLSLRVDGEWISKEDGSDPTDVEAFKGAISGAIKRAAVPWGIGAYLYKLESNFVNTLDHNTRNAYRAKTKDGTEFFWLPPELPAWAIPSKEDTINAAQKATAVVEAKLEERLGREAQGNSKDLKPAKEEPRQAGIVLGKVDPPGDDGKSPKRGRPGGAAKAEEPKGSPSFEIVLEVINSCESMEELKQVWQNSIQVVASYDQPTQAVIIAAKDKKKNDLS